MNKSILYMVLMVILSIPTAAALSYPDNRTYYSDYNGSVILNNSVLTYCYLNDSDWTAQTDQPATYSTWFKTPATLPDANYSLRYSCAQYDATYLPNTSYDISGNGNTGTNTGYTWNHGRKYGGVDCTGQDYCLFDGIDDYIRNLDNTQLDSIQSFSFWIKPIRQNDAYNRIIITKANTYKPGLTIKGNTQVFNLYDTTGNNDYFAVAGWEIWQHVVITIANDSGTYKARGYLNGAPKTWQSAASTTFNVDSLTILNNGNPLYIMGATANRWVNGSIKNIQAWSRQLSDTEVQAQYNAGMDSPPLESEGLVLWMPMRNITQNATYTYDVNNLMADNSTGEAAHFDGVDDYTSLSSNIEGFGADITLCFDFMANEYKENDTIIGLTTEKEQSFIAIDQFGLGQRRFYGSTEVNDTYYWGTFPSLSFGKYNRYCAVYNSTESKIYTYINGGTKVTNSGKTGAITFNEFGRRGNVNDYTINSSLDNVIVFDGAFTDAEVLSLNTWLFNPTDTIADGLVYYNTFNIDDRITGDYVEPDFWFILDTIDLNVTLHSPANNTKYGSSQWLNVTYSDANLNWTTTQIIRGSDSAVLYTNSSGVLAHDITTYTVLHYINISNGSYGDGNYTITFTAEDYNALHPYSTNITFEIQHTSIFFKVFDESTNAVLNMTNVTLNIVGPTIYNYTITNGSLAVNETTPGDYTIYYSANGYSDRLYYTTITIAENHTIYLYLINTSVADQIIETIYDQDSRRLEGYIVKLQRYYSADNAYKTVSMRTTNTQGEVVWYVELYDVFYKQQIEDSTGEIVDILSSNPFLSSTPSVFINIEDNIYTSWAQLNNLVYNISFINTTGTTYARFIWSDINNLVRYACLKVTRYDTLGTYTVGNNCTYASSGTLTIPINTSESGQFKAVGIIDTNTEYSWYTLDVVWYMLPTAYDFGDMGVFVSILMIGGLATMGLGSITGSVVLMLLGLIGTAIIGLVSGITLGMLMYVVILGFIVIFLVRRRGMP